MQSCRSCKAELAADSRFCPQCGAPAQAPLGIDSGATLTAPERAAAPATSTPPPWHGRFEPGTRLGTRYRIVGFLGKGGMGEVYRADDLELNQPVALKFLSARIRANAAELERFRKEVRIARGISHPNVCRTYDISTVDDQVFLVMEYIGGEDLGSVLRRLGRPSRDKAVEIARQVCLGLGAAHEGGILHRDLKPANVMIDDRGRARITDFGLAGLADELAHDRGASGTLAYMAPEQLAGGAPSIQSDLYSLGLVLYELFTGKRAYESQDIAEIRRIQSDSSIRTPSSLVQDIDPAVERVIMRCLEPEPRNRPTSAYAVLGSLPGGDPLAAALAAGETPSPELVANAGVAGSVRSGVAIACVIFVLATVGWWTISEEKRLLGFNRSDAALTLRSEEVLAKAGIVAPRYSYGGFVENFVYFAQRDRGDSMALAYGAARPEPSAGVLYWRRWSRQVLTHPDVHNPIPNLFEPPPGPGSVMVLMDADGRLVHLSEMPADASGRARSGPDEHARGATDWPAFVDAAGYDASRMVGVPRDRSLSIGTDSVTAGSIAGASGSGHPITLWARWLDGRVVHFWVDAPWGTSRDLFAFEPSIESEEAARWPNLLLFSILPFAAALLFAIRNLRAGRGDRRGAMWLSVFIFLSYMAMHLLVLNVPQMGLAQALEIMIRKAPIVHSLSHAVIAWLAYMALEPYLRRLWPRVLVSWARLLSGRLRDPMIGRDVLAGFLFASVTTAVMLITRTVMGTPDGPGRLRPDIVDSLSSVGSTLSLIIMYAGGAPQAMMAFFTVLLISRILFRSDWAAIAVAISLFGWLFSLQVSGEMSPAAGAVTSLLGATSLAYVALRFGFLAALTGASVTQVMLIVPWTIDLSAWYSNRTIIGATILGALLSYGFTIALGGRAIFRDLIQEPTAVQRR